MQAFVQIKPLSINKAFQGRRFKTVEHKAYEQELLLKLPYHKIKDNTPFFLKVEAGLSSKNSDLSNVLKLLEDILCKKYNIDDRFTYKIYMEKKIVQKGEEYLKIEIESIEKFSL